MGNIQGFIFFSSLHSLKVHFLSDQANDGEGVTWGVGQGKCSCIWGGRKREEKGPGSESRRGCACGRDQSGRGRVDSKGRFPFVRGAQPSDG